MWKDVSGQKYSVAASVESAMPSAPVIIGFPSPPLTRAPLMNIWSPRSACTESESSASSTRAARPVRRSTAIRPPLMASVARTEMPLSVM